MADHSVHCRIGSSENRVPNCREPSFVHCRIGSSENVERLIEKDQLRRAGNGELEVVEHFPATRPICTTDLPDGTVKLEVGSDYLELTPAEARTIARKFYGHLHDLAQAESSNKAVVLCHELARELKEARREIKALRNNVLATDVEGKQLALLT